MRANNYKKSVDNTHKNLKRVKRCSRETENCSHIFIAVMIRHLNYLDVYKEGKEPMRFRNCI